VTGSLCTNYYWDYYYTYYCSANTAFVTKFVRPATPRVLDVPGLRGGADSGNGIAVDGAGSAYVTGYTGGGVPTTASAYQTSFGGGSTTLS